QRRKALLTGDDGFVGPPRPRTSAPPVPETSGGGANKEAQAAEKFLQSLRQQLYATQDLTAEQQLYLRLQEDKLKLTPLELEQAVALARQTDVLRKANELKKDEAGLDALISGSQQRHQESLIAL